jgi:hypothetical protein
MGDYSVLLFYFTLCSISKTEFLASVKVEGFDKSYNKPYIDSKE